ncbi:MAG TPA: L,D-transpeptidase family protein [Gemmatimonadota bacterium]|nr:L,D-transpeptidase family protein [Gemmatimonadota bacterium]
MERIPGSARPWAIALAIAAGACAREEPPAEPADVYWFDESLTDAQIEAGRRDSSWRQAVRLGRRPTVVTALDTVPIPEGWQDLAGAGEHALGPTPRDETIHVPVFGDAEGPSVLYVQILLDRARFSPGVLDGKWGKNTEKAVVWFQDREGLPTTGIVDSVTLSRLRAQAGSPATLLGTRVLTEDDMSGPFVAIPADVYRWRDLACMCYESPGEKLAERYHASPALLSELNGGRVLDSLTPGDTLVVPNLREEPAPAAVGDSVRTTDGPRIERLVVSGRGFYVHALDEEGRLLFHFPTTLGSGYDPSPAGEVEIVSITPDPWFHYQPRLLSGVDRSKPSTLVPPGPNNPVGGIWIKLSEPHYGIHGTREPATIGYETSSGCVRLTNWDAAFLGARLAPGMRVEFRDTRIDAATEGGVPDPSPLRRAPEGGSQVLGEAPGQRR